jgi:hypothetical protein
VFCSLCGSFNSSLATECDECGVTLANAQAPESGSGTYRAAANLIVPNDAEKEKLELSVHAGLLDGRSVDELTEALEQKGYDSAWAASFVLDLETRFEDDEWEEEGDLAVGFLLGLFCFVPAVIGVLAGLGKPRTRKGVVRGALVSIAVAVLVRLCAGPFD